MRNDTILIKQCHKEYTDKFLALREIHKLSPNDSKTIKLMSKWSCLVDLMTRLNNSVVAEERRKQNDKNKRNDQNS